jgi:hypothetical protein
MSRLESLPDTSISTTQRYTHLTPTALENAIRLLETQKRGDRGETANG